MLLVNPRVALSTADVFAGWDGDRSRSARRLARGRNDLEAPAIALVPQIETVLAWLSAQPGADIRRACRERRDLLRLVRQRAKRATRAAEAVPREWWHLATSLR